MHPNTFGKTDEEMQKGEHAERLQRVLATKFHDALERHPAFETDALELRSAAQELAAALRTCLDDSSDDEREELLATAIVSLSFMPIFASAQMRFALQRQMLISLVLQVMAHEDSSQNAEKTVDAGTADYNAKLEGFGFEGSPSRF